MMISDIFEVITKLDEDQIDKDKIKLLIENLDESILSEVICYVDKNICNKLQVLNFIAVKLFENKKYELIIPLLQKCLGYNKSDYDTLMNLIIVLETFGEYKLALEYAEMIQDKNDEVINLISNIRSKIEVDNRSDIDIEQNDVEFTGERLIINREVKEKYNDVLEEHLERYKLATHYVKDKIVLDAACGAGYGSKMIATSGAKFVTAVDISSESLKNAEKAYYDKNINFIQGDVNQLPFDDETFDVVISFETIEHIKDGSKWIRESSRLLKEEGIFIVSTPNRNVTNPGTFFYEKPLNPYHQYEYNIQEFIGELTKEYDIVDIYGQTFINDSETYYTKIMRNLRKIEENEILCNSKFSDHKLIELSEIKDASPMYVVAVCKKKVQMSDSEKLKNTSDNIKKNFNHFGENTCLASGDIVGAEAIYIGDNVRIKSGYWLNYPLNNFDGKPRIIIKDGCQIGKNLSISIVNRAVIGNNVLMGSNVYIADCGHEYKDIGVSVLMQGVTATDNEVVIGDNCWLGINSVVVGNVHIGKGSIVGANSFVNKDIPDYCVAAGNPARVVKAFDVRIGKWVKIKDNDELQQVLSHRKDYLDYIVPFTNLKSLQVEVSSACNLRCPQCFNNIEGHKIGFFSKKLWNEKIKPVLSQLNDIYLVGIGEPFLCKDFFYFVEDSVKNNVNVHTTSNLQLVDDEMAEKIVASGICELSFSCDGDSKEVYEKIRINGSFDKLKKSLNLIQKYKEKYNTNLPKLILNFGAVKSNIDELPSIVEFAKEFDVDSIMAYHDIIYRKELKDESLFNYQKLSDKKFTEAAKIAKDLNVSVFFPGLFSSPIKYNPEKIYCQYPFLHLWVYSDGRTGPCCMDFPDRYILGDLKENSLKEIWNSIPVLELRKEQKLNPSYTCRYCVMHGKMDISDSRYFFRFTK